MTTAYKKPIPHPADPELTRPFWEAAKRHELLIPRCKSCGNYFWYPRRECPNCLSTDVEWAPASGKAHLFTFTVVRQPLIAAFNDDVPYIYAVVRLDEGPLMVSNVVECPVEDVKVDMRLVAHFDDVTQEWTLVKFRPA